MGSKYAAWGLQGDPGERGKGQNSKEMLSVLWFSKIRRSLSVKVGPDLVNKWSLKSTYLHAI